MRRSETSCADEIYREKIRIIHFTLQQKPLIVLCVVNSSWSDFFGRTPLVVIQSRTLVGCEYKHLNNTFEHFCKIKRISRNETVSCRLRRTRSRTTGGTRAAPSSWAHAPKDCRANARTIDFD